MTFVPENKLERKLVRAAEDRANEPAFYESLLESNLFVIGEADAERQLRIHSIAYNANDYLAVFSSLKRLREFTKPDEVPYVSMTGRDLFETTRGAAFILNPGASYGKELLVDEIARLLDGNGPRQVVFDRPQSALIGQPKVWPTALVDGLKAAFAEWPEIGAAYLVQIAYPGADTPHPLIGVEVDGAWEPVSQEIGRVIATLSDGGLVDAIEIDRTQDASSLSGALLKTEPFYVRGKTKPN